jgi:hypothetical protein
MPDRLKNALPGGLPKYVDIGLTKLPNNSAILNAQKSLQSKTEKLDKTKDWRVRISLPPGSKFAFRGQSGKANGNTRDDGEGGTYSTIGFMYPLSADSGPDGVVFPQTPSITVTHNARYQEQALTHSNYKSYFYEGSDVSAIQIAGVFTCQNAAEAEYVMACVQFLRACTKMFFGKTSGASMPSGTPPTLVRLSGYGDFYLPDLTCVVTSIAHTMPEDCDYIKFLTVDGENYGWMPTVSTITVTLQPVVSRKRQAEEMSLDKFVNAEYIRKGGNGGLI